MEKTGRNREISREELIEFLRLKAKELGRPPKVVDVKESTTTMPPYNRYYQEFNSWNNALAAAGLEPNIFYYSKPELIAILKQKAKKLGRSPKISDMRSDKLVPSYATYQKMFGSWNKALEAADLIPNVIHEKVAL